MSSYGLFDVAMLNSYRSSYRPVSSSSVVASCQGHYVSVFSSVLFPSNTLTCGLDVDYDSIDESKKPTGKEALSDGNAYEQPVVLMRRNFDNPNYNSLNPVTAAGMTSGTFAPDPDDSPGNDKPRLAKVQNFENPNYGLAELTAPAASGDSGTAAPDEPVYECPHDVSDN